MGARVVRCRSDALQRPLVPGAAFTQLTCYIEVKADRKCQTEGGFGFGVCHGPLKRRPDVVDLGIELGKPDWIIPPHHFRPSPLREAKVPGCMASAGCFGLAAAVELLAS